ncbi:MAG: LacI family DNA-binding transcriptional regulator [Chthoniobacteraceae bacterium]
MPSQKEIAIRAGLTQATVSMALRNHPAICLATREHVQRIAREMGYRPNPFVASLMTHIRSGRRLEDQGTLAVIVDMSREEWFSSEVYNSQYEGARQRAEQLGYNMECFFWKEYGTSNRLDRVLYARGITGVLLAPPQNRPESPVRLRWENYAYAAIAYSWPDLVVHRSATHHRHNVDMVYRELLLRGYKRIGLCLPTAAVEGVDANWLAGFLIWQQKFPPEARIPLLVTESLKKDWEKCFHWFKSHKPDVVVGIKGDEKQWMDALGLRIPDDVGLACINRSRTTPFSGVIENHEAVGASAADLLIHQIQSNERGFVVHPQLLLLDGTWVEGTSLRARKS